MNESLCKHFGDGAFPKPSKLSSVEPEKLQTSCGVGYRAKSIVSLAQQVYRSFSEHKRNLKSSFLKAMHLHALTKVRGDTPQSLGDLSIPVPTIAAE